MKQGIFILLISSALIAESQDFRDTNLDLEERVNLLIQELTLDEKISLMPNKSAAIERLDIPYYDWWNEGLHGVARSAPATVFPQAIGMAASFDPGLIEKVATAISDEGRALYHEAIKKGIHKQYLGITYWSPNINIFRDPRWGRGHETYGEDPFLTGELGAAFVRGLQGNNERYLKTAACAKHFAVHNGPESKRHVFNAESNQKDLYETYLPAFKRLVDEDVAGVMCAYNRLNAEACCASPTYLVDILRKDWNFRGYVVSDCGALNDLHANHKVSGNIIESAAAAIKSDVNVNCGSVYNHLQKAVDLGLITETDIDKALAKQLAIRFKLGMFDPDPGTHFPDLKPEIVGCDAHQELAREIAQRSIVLLKNQNNTLPLNKDIGHLFVSGNNAADLDALMGNYYAVSKNYVTILEGIANKVSNTSIIRYEKVILLEQDQEKVKTGQVGNARRADAAIAVVGLSGLFEGEEGGTPFSKTGGDRDRIELPESQMIYLRELRKACKDKPLIVVICSGSALAIPELHDMADAIVWAWYPGEQGGNAVADVLFGDVSPSGKLPVTMYNSTEQLADFEDYSISGSKQTYRYFEGEVLYPFGFGLSYNNIKYTAAGSTYYKMKRDKTVEIEVSVRNNGNMTQNEAVQLYVAKPGTPFPSPKYALKAIQNITLQPSEEKKITFSIGSDDLKQVNMEGESVLLAGEYKIWIGQASPAKESVEKGCANPVGLIINVE